mmetsp:Transcript_87667/g.252822  ORF Transcript_87667/g.252822 Transcript_87667/m.252822 type:complete len:291 (+) Transcript_87667:597-1469(+)
MCSTLGERQPPIAGTALPALQTKSLNLLRADVLLRRDGATAETTDRSNLPGPGLRALPNSCEDGLIAAADGAAKGEYVLFGLARFSFSISLLASSLVFRRRMFGSTMAWHKARASSDIRRPPMPKALSKPLPRKSSWPCAKLVMLRAPRAFRNGWRPPNINMYMHTPVAHTSTATPYPLLREGIACCSGAMNAGVPHFSFRNPLGQCTARPRSASFSLGPSAVWATRKLSGFTSRWQICLECKNATAANIWCTQKAISGSWMCMPRSRTLSPKSPPSQYSRAMNMLSASS